MRRGLFTGREDQVLALIAGGCTDKEVAARLGISRRTVATHMHRIFVRHGLKTRAAAIALWIKTPD